MVLAINQDVKFENILPKHTSLNHHLQNAYIPLDHRISIAQQTGSTEEFGADSIITDVCIGTF